MTLRFAPSLEARAQAWINATGDSDRREISQADLLYAMVRLAASRVCPCTRDVLGGVVAASLRGLVSDDVSSAVQIDAAIDDLIASGDLMIGSLDVDSRVRRMVCLGPPMFVRRASGAVFIMGGIAESVLPSQGITRYRGAFRELEPPPADDELVDHGFSPYPRDAWMESPAARKASGLVAELDRMLTASPPSGAVLDLEILDPASRPEFYKGRWVAPRKQSGRFVVRRSRRWGGRSWGYAELADGSVSRLVTFPAIDDRFRGCDEAWWAICALDALQGRPQSLLTSNDGEVARVGLAMPLPMWAERRLLTVGKLSAIALPGALLAYDLPRPEAPEEIAFLHERLWLEPKEAAL
jgi:hypothetical protein